MIPVKKEKFKGQREVCKLLDKWRKIVDNPKKKRQADKIMYRIFEIKGGNIRPF